MDFNRDDIKKNVDLSQYNTYRVGGKARFFYEAKSDNALCDAVMFANKEGVAFTVLGGGTNILVPGEGFDGLVIKMTTTESVIKGELIYADAGVSMGALVQKAKQAGLSGLEWAAGLPGTLGGAIYGNAGSCGKEMKDTIESVNVFSIKTFERKKYTNTKCNFFYRHSIFKESHDIILSAVLQLQKGDIDLISAEMKKNMQFRIAHQPLSDRSEGCVFKNIEIVKSEAAKKLVQEHPDFMSYAKNTYLSAGLLIDKAGMKNVQVHGAKVSNRHANFIVIDENTKTHNVEELIALIKKQTLEMFGIELEEEIQRLKKK